MHRKTLEFNTVELIFWKTMSPKLEFIINTQQKTVYIQVHFGSKDKTFYWVATSVVLNFNDIEGASTIISIKIEIAWGQCVQCLQRSETRVKGKLQSAMSWQFVFWSCFNYYNKRSSDFIVLSVQAFVQAEEFKLKFDTSWSLISNYQNYEYMQIHYEYIAKLLINFLINKKTKTDCY